MNEREIETMTFGEAIAAYGFNFAVSLLGKDQRTQVEMIEARENPTPTRPAQEER